MTKGLGELIARLNLQPHPEGGFYRETFRASHRVQGTRGALRSAATSIYFLLPSGVFSAWHRVEADETWHFYDGRPLELVTLDAVGQLTRTVLGRDVLANQTPQHTVPAGVFQAARPLGLDGSGHGGDDADGYTLCGCTVSPGFDFEDFTMPSREAMMALYATASDEVRARVVEFTR